MSKKSLRSINPAEHAPPGGHYSHGTVANGFVFVSGQLPITPSGEKLVHAPFGEQARQVLANVERVLQACGSGVAHLVQVRVYVDWTASSTGRSSTPSMPSGQATAGRVARWCPPGRCTTG